MYGEPGGLEGKATVASILKEQGYVTQGVGKWHMGESKGSVPQDVGFDDFYGFLGVSDMYTEWRDIYFNPEIAYSPERYKMLKNLDQDWAQYSENFIESMKDSDKPFFLYHGTRAAHFDNYPNDEFAGKSAARTTFSDAIVEIDDIFGRLVRKLEETGQLENTLIIFGSDNGPEAEVSPHGRTPFRGSKGSSWEGGVRVPTFAYWKYMIEPRRSEGLFDYADIFNTCLSVAGIDGAKVNKHLPAERYVDGIDQSSYFLAKNGQSARKSIIFTMNSHVSAVRIDEFKYHLVVQLQNALFPLGLKGGFSGAIVQETGGVTVTNLYTNPQEDISVGIRHLPVTIPLGVEGTRYQKVLEKYLSNISVVMPGRKN